MVVTSFEGSDASAVTLASIPVVEFESDHHFMRRGE